MEQAVAALEEKTHRSDFYAQPFAEVQPVLDEIKAAKATLDQAMERWTELETLKEDAERTLPRRSD